jgi:hypothetical protein
MPFTYKLAQGKGLAHIKKSAVPHDDAPSSSNHLVQFIKKPEKFTSSLTQFHIFL